MERIRNISELPPGLRQRAERYREIYTNMSDVSDDISVAFIWSSTPEGDNFWSRIYEGDYHEDMLRGRPKAIQTDDQIIM